MAGELQAEEAARIIGLPAEQLRIWAYDRVGPQNSGTINKPEYKAEHLQQWLHDKGMPLARSVG